MALKVITKRKGGSPLIGIYAVFSAMSKYIADVLEFNKELEFFVEFKNRSSRMVVNSDDWYKAGLIALKKLRDSEYVERIVKEPVSEKFHIISYGDKLLRTNFKLLSNDVLANIFQEGILKLVKFNLYDALINVSEFDHELFTKKLKKILESACKNKDISVDETYVILTTPKETTWIQEQEEDFLKMLKHFLEDKEMIKILKKEKPEIVTQRLMKFPKLNKLLDSHLKKYFWMQYEQEGESLTHEYFINLLVGTVKDGLDPQLELNKISEKRKKLVNKQKKLFSLLNFSDEEKYWLSIAPKIMFWKLHLREVRIKFYCCVDGLIEEIAKRLNLDKVQVRHMNCEELVEALKKGRADVSLLNERIRHCVVHFYKGKAQFFVGKEAVVLSNQFVEDTGSASIKEIKGACAYQGYAKGVVKQVLKTEDMVKFNKGDILIAYMTDPGVVPAMKKAAAIVTDVGGITCHAAIVAREFGVPCVVGTKIATKTFKDGDIVEVDAEKGIVRKIKS